MELVDVAVFDEWSELSILRFSKNHESVNVVPDKSRAG